MGPVQCRHGNQGPLRSLLSLGIMEAVAISGILQMQANVCSRSFSLCTKYVFVLVANDCSLMQKCLIVLQKWRRGKPAAVGPQCCLSDCNPEKLLCLENWPGETTNENISSRFPPFNVSESILYYLFIRAYLSSITSGHGGKIGAKHYCRNSIMPLICISWLLLLFSIGPWPPPLPSFNCPVQAWAGSRCGRSYS